MSVHIQGTVSAHRCRDSAALAPADTSAAGTWSETDKAPGGFIQYVLFIAHTHNHIHWSNNNNKK